MLWRLVVARVTCGAKRWLGLQPGSQGSHLIGSLANNRSHPWTAACPLWSQRTWSEKWGYCPHMLLPLVELGLSSSFEH
jgi:hypothetical protein